MVKRTQLKESRRDDIIARRDAYRAAKQQRQDLYNQQEQEYDDAVYAVAEELERYVLNAIQPTSLDIDIRVEPYGRYGSRSYSVEVHGDERRKFDEGSALTWDWRVYLDKDGNIIKESNSYSGLRATTREQLDNLKETLRVLELLNDMDWSEIIGSANARKPRRQDYISAEDPRYEKEPDFSSELKQITIEDAIGNRVLIKGNSYRYDGAWHRGGSYYIIHNQTPKQTSVTEFPVENYQWVLDNDKDTWDYINRVGLSYRVATDKFMRLIPDDPEIIEL